MAITRSFGGQTLLKPGAYSVSRVDNAQGIAVGENNTLMLIGEASDGVPGGTENSRIFTNIQNLVDYYVSGDIVDAALVAGRPSITPGISAPTNFIVFKTNNSGAGLQTITVATTETTNIVTIGESIAVTITYPINAAGETFTQTVNIPFSKTITVADGVDDVAVEIVAGLEADGNISALFDISQSSGVVSITSKKNGPQFGPDNATNLSGKVIVSVVASVTSTPLTTFTLGLGSSQTESDLSQLGQTTVAQLTAAFVDAFNFDPNVIVPLWSNPAVGINSNPTPGGANHLFITAPLAGAQLQNHLVERSSVTVRKEAQGFIGIRNADWKNSYRNGIETGDPGTSGLLNVNSFLIQAVIQDIRVIDASGALAWKAPHIMAALMAGIRLGSTVGEPLTFKFLNANGVGHNINFTTGMPNAAATQFRPGFDFNEAILNGLTFTEIASGGNRVVVDNTRYAIDESFVFNRGSVIEAAQFVARTSRQLLETIFVGNKVSNGAALSLKNVLRNYLIQLNTDQIITTSEDAPFGFVEDTFTVTINGNTAEIQVEVKPVQGLDFIFIDFTLGNITQQA